MAASHKAQKHNSNYTALYTRPCPFMQRKGKCPRGRACPDYHTAAQQRRDPYSHFYLPVACPAQFEGCPQGEQCKYAHTVTEQEYHPVRYRTFLCVKAACRKDVRVRAVCPLAHSSAEKCRALSRAEYELAFLSGKAAEAETAEEQRSFEQMQQKGYPKFWELGLNGTQRVVTKPLPEGSEEYNLVFSQFIGQGDVIPSGFPAAVRRILRVQNPDEYDYYALTRAKVGGERWLFHGTSADAAERIAAVGFDRSFSRRCAFGPGCYFARTPSVSVQYCDPDEDGVQRMFLAQVLVGTWTSTPRGGSPPVVKTERAPGYARFDSVVDSEFNPDIFVVFQDHQAYPAYLIEFTVLSPGSPSLNPQRAGTANPTANQLTSNKSASSNANPSAYPSTNQSGAPSQSVSSAPLQPSTTTTSLTNPVASSSAGTADADGAGGSSDGSPFPAASNGGGASTKVSVPHRWFCFGPTGRSKEEGHRRRAFKRPFGNSRGLFRSAAAGSGLAVGSSDQPAVKATN
ncbi:hypothetical protein KFL_000180250 [Klebsormidium nitens]|uniref:Poly [ADP-ribose] polymerase n=1 Tax=Klebsormidium nitens TaxID=105231 RepID=A0A1Y1HM32_KLENI|nr:hypothetical protein KFL_000180250 [Klebsormidium nitens]|eukprot:GAQ78742.1 hypothetical protein KFL_000180250 [Klebsormidium nitens]